MDRVFLDANVLFSAAYASPRLGLLWELARAGRCRLLASAYVADEAGRNLAAAQQRERLADLLRQVELVLEAPLDLPCPLPLPEKDRPVFLAALAASATHLLTGDVTHFGPYYGRRAAGVHILPPGDYLRPAATSMTQPPTAHPSYDREAGTVGR